MSGVCEVIIYTSNGALSFYVEATTNDFQDRLAAALEEGTVLLDTIDNNKLILNAINIVAIEICEPKEQSKSSICTPPVSKI